MGRWIGTDIYASKDWIVICGDNMRRDYDGFEGCIGRSYDEIEGVTVSVSRNFTMLSEITTGKEFIKLDCWSIAEVVSMDSEVISDDEFMMGGGCVGKKR